MSGDMIPRAIDEIPVLCVAASYAEGTTVIRDAAELRVKESDRIATMAAELRKMGVAVTELPDGMEITGREALTGRALREPRRPPDRHVHGRCRSCRPGGYVCARRGWIDTSFPGFERLLRQAAYGRRA